MNKSRRKLNSDEYLYYVFSHIWGWNGKRADPERYVKRLDKFLKSGTHISSGDLKFHVGLAYLCGILPGGSDEETAARWFESSNSHSALMAEGYLYEKGLAGRQKDMETAIQYYLDAASQGNAPAKYRLACFIYDCKGANKESIKLLRQAVKSGYWPAEDVLTRLKWERKYGFNSDNSTVQQAKDMILACGITEDQLKELLEKYADKISEVIERKSDEMKDSLNRMEKTMNRIGDNVDAMWCDLIRIDNEHKEQLKALYGDMKKTLAEVHERHPEALEDENKFMKLLFAEDWRNESRLCNQSADALVSALAMLRYGNSVGLKDYSGIILMAMGALEIETRRRFHTLYIDYLHKNRIQIEQFPASLIFDNRETGLLEESKYTLGSLEHILRPKYGDHRLNDFLLSEVLSDAAKEVLSDAKKEKVKNQKNQKSKNLQKEESLKSAADMFNKYKPYGSNSSFLNAVLKDCKEYRNKSAHFSETMTEDDAIKCCEMLGVYLSADTRLKLKNDKEAEKEFVNVGGLLKQLLWLTKPLKVDNSNS